MDNPHPSSFGFCHGEGSETRWGWVVILFSIGHRWDIIAKALYENDCLRYSPSLRENVEVVLPISYVKNILVEREPAA